MQGEQIYLWRQEMAQYQKICNHIDLIISGQDL